MVQEVCDASDVTSTYEELDKAITDEAYVASTYEQMEAGVTDDAYEMPQENASSSSSTCQGAEDHIYDQPTQLAALSKGAKKPEHTQVSPRQLSSDEVDEAMELKENMSYLQSRGFSNENWLQALKSFEFL